MMSYPGVPIEEIEKELFKDEEFKREYERLKPQYEIISKMIKMRIEQNLTQEQLAEKIGISKSTISRIESGNQSPSLDFMQKLADGMGKKINIEFN